MTGWGLPTARINLVDIAFEQPGGTERRLVVARAVAITDGW
jgi:hypothetical protein